MKQVLIAGGTGSVGEGLAKTALENGWRVVVPGRSNERLQRLTNYCDHHPELITVQGNFSSPGAAGELCAQVKKVHGGFDLIIASLGGWKQGPSLPNTSWEDWEEVLRDNLSAHFLLMKYGVPILKSDGVFVHINGLAVDAVIPTAGPIVAAAAAQQKLALTLAAELKKSGMRVYELLLGVVHTRARQVLPHEAARMVNPDIIMRYILRLIEHATPQSQQTLHRLADAESAGMGTNVSPA